MRSMILAIGCLIGVSMASAETRENLEGLYTGAAYNGPSSYQNAWVEIRKSAQGELELVFNVPCDTKLRPRIFKINVTSEISGELELVEPGAGQCYTGHIPSVVLIGNTLQITTNPRIWTPGFDGTYELSK